MVIAPLIAALLAAHLAGTIANVDLDGDGAYDLFGRPRGLGQSALQVGLHRGPEAPRPRANSIQPHVAKSALEPQTLKCTANKTFDNGAWEEHELTLAIKEGRVVALAYSNTISNGEEGGAYSCEVDLEEGAPDCRWVRSSRRARAIERDPERESYADIARLDDGSYEVNFENLATINHCGFGAEFPKTIVVKPSSAKCVVTR